MMLMMIDDVNISTDSLNLMSFPAGMSNANFCSTEHQSSTESNDEDDNCDAAPAAGIFENPANLFTCQLNIAMH